MPPLIVGTRPSSLTYQRGMVTEYTDGGDLDSNFLVLGGNVHRAVMMGKDGMSPGIQLILETYQGLKVPLLFSEECARDLARWIRVALHDIEDTEAVDG